MNSWMALPSTKSIFHTRPGGFGAYELATQNHEGCELGKKSKSMLGPERSASTRVCSSRCVGSRQSVAPHIPVPAFTAAT